MPLSRASLLLALLLLVGGCSLWSKEPPPPPAEPRYEAGRRLVTAAEYDEPGRPLAVPLRFKGGAVFYNSAEGMADHGVSYLDEQRGTVPLSPKAGLRLADYRFIREHCDVSSWFRDPRADRLPEACRLSHLDVMGRPEGPPRVEAIAWAKAHSEPPEEAIPHLDLPLAAAYNCVLAGRRVRLGPLTVEVHVEGQWLLLSEDGRSFGAQLLLADFATAERRALLRRCPPPGERPEPRCRIASLELTLRPSEGSRFRGEDLRLAWEGPPPPERIAPDLFEELSAEPERLLGEELRLPITALLHDDLFGPDNLLLGRTYALRIPALAEDRDLEEALLRRGCVTEGELPRLCEALEARFRVASPLADGRSLFTAQGLAVTWKEPLPQEPLEPDPDGLPRIDLVDIEVNGERFLGQRVSIAVAAVFASPHSLIFGPEDAEKIDLRMRESIWSFQAHDRVRAMRHCSEASLERPPALCRVKRLTAVLGREDGDILLVPGTVAIAWSTPAPPAPGASLGIVDWAALFGEREHFAGRPIRLYAEALTAFSRTDVRAYIPPGDHYDGGWLQLPRLAKEDRMRAAACSRGCRIKWVEAVVGYGDDERPFLAGEDWYVGWP